MNVSLHIDASELTHLELADRKHQSQGRRLVSILSSPSAPVTVWVASASEARDVACAFLALAGEIDLDDLRASMDTLPSLHCEMAAQSPPTHLYPHIGDGKHEEAGWLMCGHSDPITGMYCTRRGGHEGEHQALDRKWVTA